MNGIVANPTLPFSRRIVRGILVLGCCVLSASLVGAVHTLPQAAARRVQPVVVQPPAVEATVEASTDAEEGATLASYQPVTRRELTASRPSALLPAVLPPAVARPAPKLAPGTELMKESAAPGRFRVVMMEVTAYCPCKKCCGPRAQGLTASGRPVSFNGGRFVAADKALSFNTNLLIPGYAAGQSVPVLDRGGAIKGNKLDVYFPTHDEARQWGRRFIPVTVLE